MAVLPSFWVVQFDFVSKFYEHNGKFSRSPRPSSCCMLWGHHRRGWISVVVGFTRFENSRLSLERLRPIWPGRDGRFRVFSRVWSQETRPSGPSCCLANIKSVCVPSAVSGRWNGGTLYAAPTTFISLQILRYDSALQCEVWFSL